MWLTITNVLARHTSSRITFEMIFWAITQSFVFAAYREEGECYLFYFYFEKECIFCSLWIFIQPTGTIYFAITNESFWDAFVLPRTVEFIIFTCVGAVCFIRLIATVCDAIAL